MIATVGATAQISSGWKWLAVLIGLAVIGLLWVAVGLTNRKIGWRIWKLVEGADGTSSTSKFQWLVWLVVVLFAYTVLWVLRAKGGNYGAITNVPANLLTVLGFSTATALAAKGITVGYVQSGRITKPSSPTAQAATPDGAGADLNQGGILRDDSGYPELAKIQMVGFTFIAVGIFLATLIHQIHSNPVQTDLPNIDSSLLVLMGISQGGYIGKKLVSITTPVLYPFSPSSVAHGGEVTVQGASLGQAQGGSQLLLDGYPIQAKEWTDTSIKFDIPNVYPGANLNWTPPQLVRIAVEREGGERSNEALLTVT
jgi:hypothetical protein